MSRYIVTSGSKFEPFTYDEIVKPLQQMQEAENAAQDVYDTLGAEASALGQYITDNPDDEHAKQMYNDYMTKLQSLQNNLWNNGYTPTTRRDLTQARSAFGNISRISAAVKARQERSKSYWDFKHQHPDMIMSADPGKAGLDNYLDNDLYGQDWYQYSGESFAKEVSDDAKNRAKELLRTLPDRIGYNKDIEGYITRIVNEGFTSQEVANANKAVDDVLATNNTSALNNLPEAERILATTLLSHIESTGALGKVSPEEFGRLVDYGKKGLSSAIGETKMTDLTDYAWKAAHTGKGTTKTGDTTRPLDTGYMIGGISSPMAQSDWAKTNTKLNKDFFSPYQDENGNAKQIILNNPDRSGRPVVLGSEADMQQFLDSLGRRDFVNSFGFDPMDIEILPYNAANSNKKVERTIEFADGTTKTYSFARQDNNHIGAYTKDEKGNYRIDQEATDYINSQLDDFFTKYKEWDDVNGDVNLKDLAVTGKRLKQWREDKNLDPDIPTEYIPAIVATESKQGKRNAGTIAGSGEDMKSTREKLVNTLKARYGRVKAGAGLSKTSEDAFYKVKEGEGGFSVDKEGITDIGKVFSMQAVNSNSKDDLVLDKDSLVEVTAYPEDIIHNRARILTNKGTFLINPEYLGDEYGNLFRRLASYDNSNYKNENGKFDYEKFKDNAGLIELISLPLEHPDWAVMMSDAEQADWAQTISQGIPSYINLMPQDKNGNVYITTPKMIVMDETRQDALRNSLTRFIDSVLADPRDYLMLNPYVTPGVHAGTPKPRYFNAR